MAEWLCWGRDAQGGLARFLYAGEDRGMERAYDDVRLAGAYQAGNEMPEASLRAWVELIGSFTPQSAPAVVEIGAGTGMFCAALARWRRASLAVGVDPSARSSFEPRSLAAPAARPPPSRWSSSSSNPPKPGGGRSPHPTSSHSSAPEPASRTATSSNESRRPQPDVRC